MGRKAVHVMLYSACRGGTTAFGGWLQTSGCRAVLSRAGDRLPQAVQHFPSGWSLLWVLRAAGLNHCSHSLQAWGRGRAVHAWVPCNDS